MYKAKRLLVPIDFSSESNLALDWAVMVAKEDPQASIELFHVLPNPVIVGGPESIGIDYMSIYENEEKAMAEKLQDLRRQIPQDITSSCVVSRGSVAQRVAELCGKHSIDVVIMTTHGRKGLSHFLHGSTTEETARLAPCPVLVLHLNPITCEAAGATCTPMGEGWRS